MINLDVIRDTVLLTDAQITSYCAAQQRQFDELGHYWRLEVSVRFIAPGQDTRPGAMQLWMKDHSPEPGDLGFHDVEGNPIGYCFAADDIEGGALWTNTASHEAWEMACDPTIDRVVRHTDAAGITWETPVEVADCCEDDSFTVKYQGLDDDMWSLTCVALPSWFDPEGEAPYTWPPIPSITKPFQLAEGGYIGRREIAPHVTAWQQVFAQGARTQRQSKGWWSRTMRRFNA